MLFASFIGKHEFADEWVGLCRGHAASIGLSVDNADHAVTMRDQAVISSFHQPGQVIQLDREESGRINIKPVSIDSEFGRHSTLTINASIDSSTGTINAHVPVTTPDQLYFGEDSRGRVIGNDLRMLIKWLGFQLSELAVYSFLQYGSAAPTHSISTNVRRIPGGHKLSWGLDRQPHIELDFQARSADYPHPDPEKPVMDALLETLQHAPHNSTLFFSGGVDSSILALCFKRLGRQDVRLVNYSFGDDDPEASHASIMAAALGLPCDQIIYDPLRVRNLLEQMPLQYCTAFADFSSVPTLAMVLASAESPEKPVAVVEGTGADGAFGFGPAYRIWKKIYDIPRPMRGSFAACYSILNAWKRVSTDRLESFLRTQRRSVQMPLGRAVVSQNALDGIAYKIPLDARREIERSIAENVECISEGCDPITRLSMLDLVQVCAGHFAAKSFNPLRSAGIEPIYPFLELGLLRASLQLTWDQKCRGNGAKSILKEILEGEVPRKLIYRRKSGFAPPFAAMLGDPIIRGFIRGEMLNGSPLLELVDNDVLETIFDRAQKSLPISHGALSYLWALVFLAGWIRSCAPKH